MSESHGVEDKTSVKKGGKSFFIESKRVTYINSRDKNGKGEEIVLKILSSRNQNTRSECLKINR